MENRKFLVALSLLLLVAGAAVAGPAPRFGSVAPGYDYWQTLGSGATRYNFAQNPIPADFFCVGSERFASSIDFEGVPLRTSPADILGTTDTIIERMDTAAYNKAGVAVTRIRARALDLVATKLVRNSCGAFKVTATLAGQQPVTRLTYHRQNQYGGVFDAQLKLRVGVTFTNIDNNESRTVVRLIDMPTVTSTPYAEGTVAVSRCLSTVPIEPTPGTPIGVGTGVLVGDLTLLTGYSDDATSADHQTKLTPRRDFLPAKAQSVSSGCLCNPQGQCQQFYSWHQPDCRGGQAYDCELHFTYSACELGFTSQCIASTDRSANALQLQGLYDRGFIHEDPASVAAKELRHASQIRADQAARLEAQIREVQKQ